MNIGEANIKYISALDKDVIRCLTALYSISEGTQPLDRGFGLDKSIIDLPFQVMKNRYALDVVEKTAKYEPRVKVVSVTYTVSEATVNPTILLRKNEDYSDE